MTMPPPSRRWTTFVVILSLGAFLSCPARANWNRTAAGTYEYTDAANWASGTINGMFANAITGNQQITFGADWALTSNALRFNYTAAGNLTFRSDTTTARTLTLASQNSTIGITSDAQGSGTSLRTITIGTANNPLILNLGSGTFTHTLRPGENTNLAVNAKITGGAVGGWLSIQSKTSATAGYIALTNASSDFISNLSISAARPLQISSIADAGQASSIGAGDTIRFVNGSRADIEYLGGAASTNRTLSIESGVVHFYNKGTGKLQFTGAIQRNEGALREFRFAGTQDVDVSGTISGALQIVNYDNTRLGLTGANSFTGAIHATRGVVAFNSVADAGMNSALGAGSEIHLGSTANPASNLAGKIEYIGQNNATTNRTIKINNGAILNQGTGTLTLGGVFEFVAMGARTFALGGTHTGANRIESILSDGSSETAITTLAKQGAGRWVLAGVNSYSGGTEIEEGTLVAANNQALGSGTAKVGNATLAVEKGVRLGLSALWLSEDESRLAFHLDGNFSSTFIDTGSQLGIGSYFIDIIDSGGLTFGEYTLLAAESWEASDFYLGMMADGFEGSYLSWDGGVLTLTVVPEPTGLFLVAFGMGIAICIGRRKKR